MASKAPVPGARRFTIKGRVQGVFFRDSARRVARSLGLTGYAINLDDGNVEVLACGSGEALDKLEAWLREGPPMSNVTEVSAEAVTAQKITGFRTG